MRFSEHSLKIGIDLIIKLCKWSLVSQTKYFLTRNQLKTSEIRFVYGDLALNIHARDYPHKYSDSLYEYPGTKINIL